MSSLALKGGNPVRTEHYPKWPREHGGEMASLISVLESDDWGVLNKTVEQLAEEYCRFTGASHALPVSNGTVALEVIFRALGIGRGDEVIVPLYTFVASVTALVMVGATPVFADISEKDHLLDAVSAERLITPKTKAILAVHIGGRPCDMDAICEMAQRHNLLVVEDAAQAHGAQWREQKVGTIGIAASFSFQASKNLSCGEGGMITTNDGGLYRKMWSISNYGRSIESNVWYEHHELGTNAGMGAWQAAILLEQMRDADALLHKRMESCKYLTARLKDFPFLEFLQEDPRVVKNACHLFLFRYKSEHFCNIPRARFLEAMHAEGITVIGSGYSEPINRMKFLSTPEFYRVTGTSRRYQEINTPVADRISLSEGLWMGQSALLEENQKIDFIVEAVEKLFQNRDKLAD